MFGIKVNKVSFTGVSFTGTVTPSLAISKSSHLVGNAIARRLVPRYYVTIEIKPAKYRGGAFCGLSAVKSSLHREPKLGAIVAKYDREHTFFYLDPPCWQVAGYGVDVGWEHYEKMADLASTVEGCVLIPINDHPDIREVFKDLHFKQVDIDYTVGGPASAAQELLIWNNNLRDSSRAPEQIAMFLRIDHGNIYTLNFTPLGEASAWIR